MKHTSVYITSVIATLAIMITLYFSTKDNVITEKVQNKNAMETAESQPDISVLDKNQNGVPDWKENLDWVISSSSKVVIQSPTKTDSSTADDNSKTAELARQFMSEYMLAHKENPNMTDDDAYAIANKVIGESHVAVSSLHYRVEQLNVSTLASSTAKKQYQKDLSDILRKDYIKDLGGELDILKNALATKDEKSLKQLDPLIAKYQKTIDLLYKIPVPKEALYFHVNTLNTLSVIYSDIVAMRTMFTDPVLGFSAITKYETDLQSFYLAAQKFSTYFGQ